MEKIIIKNIVKQANRVDIFFSFSQGLKKYFLNEGHFFLEYNCDISNVPDSILVVPLLLNLLPFSWTVDCFVWVDKLDQDFYDIIPRLKYSFEEMFHHPNMGGAFIAARTEKNAFTPVQESVLLFTGGVDASTTFFRIHEKKPILLNINGWFDNDIEPNRVYDADKRAIEKFAKDYMVQSCFARSNFAKLIRASEWEKRYRKVYHTNWWFGFQHSMAFLGVASIIGYKFKVKNIYIASSYTFGQEVACASDPRTDTAVTVAGIRTIHDGYELSRQDKIEYLVKIQKQLNRKILLRVCSFQEKNCCTCEKCFRTMLAITAEGGEAAEFGFDLSGTLLNNIKKFLQTKILELNPEHIVFWKDILSRMKENYGNLSDSGKKVYHYLSNYPFEKEYKTYLWKYYRKNFFKIISRKLKLIRK